MKKENRQLLSDLGLLLVAAFWGGGFIAVKDGLNYITPIYMAAFRFIIASGLSYIFFRRKIGHIDKKEWKGGIVTGSLLFLGFLTQTIGLNYTTASKQGFLTATYVIMVPLLFWMIYRKKPETSVFVATLMTFVGIGLISIEKVAVYNVGDLLTLVCAVFFALHIIALEHYGKTYNAYKLSFMQFIVASVLFTLSALLFEPMPSQMPHEAVRAILYLGIFATFLCFSIQTIAQKYTSSSHAAILLSLESLFAAVFGVLILNEVMTTQMIIGSVLIFSAILMVELKGTTIKKLGKIQRKEG